LLKKDFTKGFMSHLLFIHAEESDLAGGFTPEEWSLVKSVMKEVYAKKGEWLWHEGARAEEIYFLESGCLDVIKKGHHLAHIKPGSWVGEIAALADEKVRSASIRAKEDSELLVFSLPELRAATQNRPEIYIKMITHLSKDLAERLRKSSETTVEALRKKLELAKIRIATGYFLCYVLMAIGSFFYILKTIAVFDFSPDISTAVSAPLILILSFFLYMTIKKSGYPLSAYGVTWRNWKRSLAEAACLTAPLMLLFLLLKWLLIATIPVLKGTPLFILPSLMQKNWNLFDWLVLTVGYSLLVPLQELMARGCLQGSLAKFLVGKHKLLFAIVLSNLIFSTLHLQISLQLAIFSFFTGCLWGFLYARHQTLVGVTLSHTVIGLWTLVVLGAL
jgi:CRP/FNR family transcriptional regulator, cyclic AMP receptor protein